MVGLGSVWIVTGGFRGIGQVGIVRYRWVHVCT